MLLMMTGGCQDTEVAVASLALPVVEASVVDSAAAVDLDAAHLAHLMLARGCRSADDHLLVVVEVIFFCFCFDIIKVRLHHARLTLTVS